MNRKKILPLGRSKGTAFILALALSFLATVCSVAQNAADWAKMKADVTMYMANDLGRNGYYDQKKIAELMGEMAGTVDP